MAWGIGVNTQWAVLKYESPMKSLNNIKSIIVNLPRITWEHSYMIIIIKNNALLMNIYNDKSKYKMDWKYGINPEKYRINQRLDLSEIYESRLTMMKNRKLILLSDEY